MKITLTIEQYFKNKPIDFLNQGSVAVLRSDGIVLYYYSNNDSDEKSLSSYFVLAAGAWQASNEIRSHVNLGDNEEIFRFSFDTSSQGVYVLSIDVHETNYLLVSTYKNEVNPGQIKSKLRLVRDGLKQHLALNEKMTEAEKEEQNKLFANITDDEIEKLFSVLEN